MITTWLAALSTVTLIGFIVLSRAAQRAPEGYEDESGFHFGREPKMTLATPTPSDSSVTYGQDEEVLTEELAEVGSR